MLARKIKWNRVPSTKSNVNNPTPKNILTPVIHSEHEIPLPTIEFQNNNGEPNFR